MCICDNMCVRARAGQYNQPQTHPRTLSLTHTNKTVPSLYTTIKPTDQIQMGEDAEERPTAPEAERFEHRMTYAPLDLGT